ncbi:2-dehydro-3-deoxy-D-gluconate 5-dehydrogenase KduD [Treponema brennaborense]|uniref:2-dehydro-3-deoxy-D-gluconate 5-dehydrogenase n=1 Tax=Treponema brennaborense (strain DSM 12168 / CIP 105900 / DD5/3) TaxID=906968 RepID=F4LN67_TREBD|nr:2-dehydro-3-deoxy-D-gluconate 5-dehydrogenase KduD [Treponema brennaborense]AEE16832.1 2-deoxy-D-gluconate 3-dehydrogenase [Treponema brennaborense DSM 12168]
MITDLFRLDGKVAVVTGANTGLGQGMCVALAEAGAKVVGVARRGCDETAALIRNAGGTFAAVKADLSSTEPVGRIIDEALASFGRIDILVNNAGIILRADAVDVTEADWDAVIAVNQKVPYFLAQAAARQFLKQHSGGKIVNVASMLSYQGGIRVPAYTASKSAVMGITKALANEWAKYGINVNAIAPGYMATNNTQALRGDSERSEAILDRIPAGRWGTPDDMKGAVVFLASEAASYVHGFTLAVDGGWLSR